MSSAVFGRRWFSLDFHDREICHSAFSDRLPESSTSAIFHSLCFCFLSLYLPFFLPVSLSILPLPPPLPPGFLCSYLIWVCVRASVFVFKGSSWSRYDIDADGDAAEDLQTSHCYSRSKEVDLNAGLCSLCCLLSAISWIESESWWTFW